MSQILVEEFGRVKSAFFHEHLNCHLQSALEGFDREYRKIGGLMGSGGHNIDRYGFAQLLATDLLANHQKSETTTYQKLRTRTIFNCTSIPATIEVCTQTETRVRPSACEPFASSPSLEALPTQHSGQRVFEVPAPEKPKGKGLLGFLGLR